jgi:hypothetical protein
MRGEFPQPAFIETFHTGITFFWRTDFMLIKLLRSLRTPLFANPGPNRLPHTLCALQAVGWLHC